GQRGPRGPQELEDAHLSRDRIREGAVHLLRCDRAPEQGASERARIDDVRNAWGRNDPEERRDLEAPGRERRAHRFDLVVCGENEDGRAGVDLEVVPERTGEVGSELGDYRTGLVQADEIARIVRGTIEARVDRLPACAEGKANRYPGAVELRELPCRDEGERIEVEVREPRVGSARHGQIEHHGGRRPGEPNLPADRRRFTGKGQRNPRPVDSGDVQDFERVVRQGQQDGRAGSGPPRLPLVDSLLIIVDERGRTQGRVVLEQETTRGGY